jgi:crossover junction endodeoxyribonuclease RuvC
MPNRLKYLFEEVNKIIKKFKPDALAIEDAFFSKNVKSAMVLGHARGSIILAAAMNNMMIREYAPRKVK